MILKFSLLSLLMKTSVWYVPIKTIIPVCEEGDRQPFAGTRELFNACMEHIGNFLKAKVRVEVPISDETSVASCVQYLYGRSAFMKLKNGKRKMVEPQTNTPRLREDAYMFLREWVDDDGDGYDSDEGEPYLYRYLRAVPFTVSWIKSFPRVRIPFSANHMLVFYPLNRESSQLAIAPTKTVEEAPRDTLMTICKRDKIVDVMDNICGGDFCVHLLTTMQFHDHYKNSITVPGNVSHVLTVLFGDIAYHAFISPWTRRETRGIWPDSARDFSYRFDPTFLVSQLFVDK